VARGTIEPRRSLQISALRINQIWVVVLIYYSLASYRGETDENSEYAYAPPPRNST